MPELVKLYIQQVAIGFALSGIFTVLLVVFDVAGLRHLLLGSTDGWLGLGLIFFFNGLVFGGVQFAIRIMRMGNDDDDDDRRGGTMIPLRIAIPPRGR